jgi:hypothetical protein
MNSNQTEKANESESVPQGTIALCALASGIYTFLLGIMLPIMLPPIPFAPLRWLLGLCSLGLCFWLYPSLHASIGREVAALAISLSNRIDFLYGTAEGHKWGTWSRSDTIMFGTNWPVTWIWLVFLGIAVAIGESFKGVWKI